MDIKITKPFKDNRYLAIDFDTVSIGLKEKEAIDLLDQLDKELNDGYTREDMDNQIRELKDEVRYLKRELNIDDDEWDRD